MQLAQTGQQTSKILDSLQLEHREAIVSFERSTAILIGDSNKLVVVSRHHARDPQVSLTSIEKVINNSYMLRWAGRMLIEDPQSYLANFLFVSFLPRCYDSIAQELSTASASIDPRSRCHVRSSTGVAIGDHINAKAHFDYHLRQFEPHAALLLHDAAFRRQFFRLRPSSGDVEELERTTNRVLRRYQAEPLPGTPSDHPGPGIEVRSTGIHIRGADGGMLGKDSTLQEVHWIVLGPVKLDLGTSPGAVGG
nr:hypothetical protein GCM10017745_51010 [Saccharothrix mutabilis subsp. capreolus]